MKRSSWQRLKDSCPKPMHDAYHWMRDPAMAAWRAAGFNITTCNVKGMEVKLRITSDMERDRSITYASKEPDTIAWMKHLLGKGGVFFDVGANVGLYSLFAAIYDPKVRVFSFEPAAQNFVSLCFNTELNELTNVTPCNFALSDKAGFGLFTLRDLVPGSSQHSFRSDRVFPGGSSRKTFIQQGGIGTTIDALISEHGLPHPTMIKIDVDGTEDDILRGADKTLASSALRSILVELNLDDTTQVKEYLDKFRRYGLHWNQKAGTKNVINGMTSQNYIFDRR